MNIILGGRGSGKTTEAIEVARERDAYLVVRHQERKRYIESVHDIDVVTYRELTKGRLEGRHPRRVVLDNADDFIRHVTGSARIDTVTMTHDDVTVLDGDHL